MLNPENVSSRKPSLTEGCSEFRVVKFRTNFAGYLSAKARSAFLPAASAVRAAPTTTAELNTSIEWGPGSGLGPPARVLETTVRTLLKTGPQARFAPSEGRVRVGVRVGVRVRVSRLDGGKRAEPLSRGAPCSECP